MTYFELVVDDFFLVFVVVFVIFFVVVFFVIIIVVVVRSAVSPLVHAKTLLMRAVVIQVRV